MAALFLGAMGQTSLTTAMPAIVADLGGFDRYTWALTSYLVAAAVTTPIVGRLADLYGRRVFFVVGLLILIVGSAPAALATTMTQLVALRAIQGIGGGIVMSNCIIAIADLFAPEERGKAQGLVGAVVFLATVAGPLVAGLVTDQGSWRLIFAVNVVAGLAVLIVVLRTFPALRPEVDDRALDPAGMAALALAVTPIMVGASLAAEGHALTSPRVGGLLAFGLAMAAVFVLIESRAAAPVMPLGIYRDRTVAASVALTALASFGLYATVLFVPLFVQSVQGVSATGSGGILAPLGLGVVFGAVASGQLQSRAGGSYRLHGVAGGLLLSGGTWLLSTMGPQTGLGVVSAYLAVAGVGVGWITTVVTVAVQNAVPFASVGVATAALQFFRQVSGSLGLAVLGAALSLRFASRFKAGLSDAIRTAVAPEQLEALRSDPRVLADPVAADALRASLAETGPEAAETVEELIGGLNAAVAGAVGDALVLCAAVTALGIVAGLWLEPGAGEATPAASS